MNKAPINKCLWFRVRLRPRTKSMLYGRVVAQRNDVWLVRAVKANGAIKLRNTVTDHVASLGSDHIHHFDSDP